MVNIIDVGKTANRFLGFGFQLIKCGVNANLKNPKDIAKAIHDLIDNSIKREEMTENGYQTIINKFNWSIEEKKLLMLYKNLLQ